MSVRVPAWDPPWSTGSEPSFVRVSSSHLKDPDWLCPEQVAKKARPEVWPADRGEFLARPPATFALGLVREAALDLLSDPNPSALEAAVRIQTAVRGRVDASREEWAAESISLAVRGLGGYVRILSRLRAAGELAPSVAVGDLVVSEQDGGGAPLEWVTWAIHHVSRDGSMVETHLLRLAPAGSVRLAPAEFAVLARIATDGFVAEPKPIKGWSSPFVAGHAQPRAPRRGRVRIIGLLDDSDRLAFDGTSAEADALFEGDIPPALPILAGGRFRPGRACATCATRQQCPGLPTRPGLLGVAGYAEATRALAPSDLTRYEICPRQVYLTRDLGMPAEMGPPSGALLRGIQVHDWMAVAHQRGVACGADDLPPPTEDMVPSGSGVVRAAGIATELGWGYDEYVTNRNFLLGHLEVCPLRRDDVTSLHHEVPATVWDTGANVVVSSRSDVVYRTSDGGLVVREVKTVSPRFVATDDESLLHQFPQLALAVCLLADGHPSFEDAEHASLTVELEVLGAAGHRIVRFDASQASTALAARTALADRVDRWMHDTSHLPGARPPCQTCPVGRFCDERRSDAGPALPPDLLLGIVEDPSGAQSWTDVSDGEVAALIEVDLTGPSDDIPF